MPIAKFIDGKGLQRIYNKQNPDTKIGYKAACEIKEKCREQYQKEFGNVELPNKNVIPLSWFELYYSEESFDPRKQRKKKERVAL